MSNLDKIIREQWAKLTSEEKEMILDRIRRKATGEKLEPIRLEDVHERLRVKDNTSV